VGEDQVKMASETLGSLYEVMERFGTYQPKTVTFRKEGVRYSSVSLNDTASVRENLVSEKDYGKISKVVFASPKIRTEIKG
jgi:hypothetical protein